MKPGSHQYKFICIFVFCFILLLIFNLGNKISAEETLNLTLAQSIDYALQQNKTFDNIKKSLQSAELNYTAVAKEKYPKLTTNYSYFRLNTGINMTMPNPLDGSNIDIPIITKNNYFWDTSISMPLYSGGVQDLSEQIAKLGIDVAKLRLIQGKNELIMAVKCYYFGILRYEKFTESFEQNLKSYQEHERITNQFYKEGLLANNSVLEAKVELANAQQELLTAQQNAEISKSTLKIAMCMDINKNIAAKDTLKKKKFDLSLEDCMNCAKKKNPELVAFIFLKQQAEKAIQLENTAYIPKIDLSAHYMKYGDIPSIMGASSFPGDLLMGMLSFKWYLFDWGQKKDEAKIKKMQLEQIINNEKITQDNTMLKIKESYAHMKTADKNFETAELALAYAKENVRVVNLRYKEQVAPSSEVIDAMTALKKAETNYNNSLYDYNIATAALEYAIGADTDKIVKS